MRSLEVMCHIDARFGGVASSVPLAAAGLTRLNTCRADVLSFARPEEVAVAGGQPTGVRLLPHHPLAVMALHRGEIQRAIKASAVVHVHGLWHPALLYAAGVALQFRVPLVISPHGMLDGWALRRKAWKKKIMSGLWQRRLLASASCLRALTEAEAADCCRYVPGTRVEVVPNGVALPPSGVIPYVPDVAKGRRMVTFLGRLHRKKGVAELLSVWPDVAATHQDTVLVLAGPDEGGFVRSGLPGRCLWLGAVEADRRWAILAASSLFVLPSHSEGFSVAVLEALASACPVLISEQCNFPEVAATGAGLICHPYTEALGRSLKAALSASRETLQCWGAKGRQLIEEKYTIEAVCSRLTGLYQSLHKDRYGSDGPVAV